MRLINFNSYIFIYLYDARWNNILLNSIRLAIRVYGFKRKGFTIKLSNDKEIKKLNFKWRKINKPTNILSFPNVCKNDEVYDNINYMGDIIISYDTLKSEASKGGLSFSSHLIHILFHGILHLEGYKHRKRVDECCMQKQEIKYLKKLNIINPYAERIKIN